MTWSVGWFDYAPNLVCPRCAAEVADELFISQATVKTHLSSVLSKLALRDRAAAIVFAHEHALLESPPQS